MGVLDGQPVNQSVTNPAFINKNVDDTTPSKLGLANTDPVSGAAVTNTQREINSVASFLGKALNSVYNLLPPWTNNQVGASTNSIFTRLNLITGLFSGTSGHTHDGTDGSGTPIALAGLGALRSGVLPLNLGDIAGTITFATPFTSSNVAVFATLYNATDSTPMYQPVTVTSVSTTGTIVYWNAPIDSSNYVLHYVAVQYA